MAGDASAYAALGLDPGADSASIEQAYRKLIKKHHPDREGGNTSRAAEIIEAYRAIRAERNLKDPLELNEEMGLPGRSGRGWVAAAMLLVVAILLFLILTGPLSSIAQPGGHRPALIHRVGGSAADPMDQPLHLAAIDGAALQALELTRTKDEMALSGASRDCHHLLRNAPTILQLDRCAAFDDAVVQLEDRDPLRDQGPFSELAVTGRVWSGASALSDDSVAIDGRLDRIRLRVEEVIAPVTARSN
jgi:DnaJ-like protein